MIQSVQSVSSRTSLRRKAAEFQRKTREGPLRFFYSKVGSYGVCGENFARELRAQGIEVNTDIGLVSLTQAPALVLSPVSDLATLFPHPESVLFTMCETTGLPETMAAKARQFTALVTPSDWCSTVFSAHKANARIHTCPLGCSDPTPKRTRSLTEVQRGGLVFSTVLDETSGILRKGLRSAIEGFELAFSAGERVEFHIKSIEPVLKLFPGIPDNRVRNVTGHWPASQLLTFVANSDVGVFPSRGEGFGLCHLDYACQAIPLISTGFGGVSEFLCPGFYSRVFGHFEPAHDGAHHEGNWIVPEVESIADSMRLVASNWITWRAKAQLMSEPARAFTWSRSASRLKWILETEGLLNVVV